ncbi:MAG: hypothetical protein ACLR4X_05430 [Clostridia bacterium]
MKKYIGFIGVAMVNCMLITGLLVHAFTLDSIKDNTVNDSKKQYVYMEKTTVKEEKEVDPEERQQEDNNNDSKNNYVVKTTTIKSTYNNSNKNYSNDNKNYSNSNTNTNNGNTNNTNNSNENDTNNNYTVEYTNTSYCGFCGKQLNNNDGICQDCREIRSKLGE